MDDPLLLILLCWAFGPNGKWRHLSTYWCLGLWLLSFLFCFISEAWALNITIIPISVFPSHPYSWTSQREIPVCFGGARLSLEAHPVCQALQGG